MAFCVILGRKMVCKYSVIRLWLDNKPFLGQSKANRASKTDFYDSIISAIYSLTVVQ